MKTKLHRKSLQIFQLTLLGALVGLLIGIIGALFLLVLLLVQYLYNLALGAFIKDSFFYYVFIVLFSVVLTVFGVYIVKYFEPKAGGSGVQEVEGILENKRRISCQKLLPIKFIGGIFSLSAGLVLGREGPMIHMGAAVGDMLKKLGKFNSEYGHILIASGAGAGLCVAFNAPLAGILFVIEEMHYQFKYSFKSIQTVIAACVIADITLNVIMLNLGFNVRILADIPMMVYQMPELSSLWLFVIFGIFFGLIGVIFNRGMIYVANFFVRQKKYSFWFMVVLVGLIIGLLSIFFPEAKGGGYTLIPEALKLSIGWHLLILIFIIRLFTTWFSYGTGVVGGFFTPMLALGTVFGVIFGMIVNLLLPDIAPDPQIFAIAGMSALFTATVGAPLTGIILVIELTMNYNLILPLILTCFSATISAMCFGARPIYAMLLKRTIALENRKNLYLRLNRLIRKK